MSDSVRPHRRQPTRLPHSPGKNTGVGCHFLLQCMKVKSESEVAQSCPTLSNPMDCSRPGSSVHGIFQARVLEWGAIAFSVFQLRVTLFNLYLYLQHLAHSACSVVSDSLWPHGLWPPVDCGLPGSSVHGIFQARILEWGCNFLLQGIFPTQGSN